jgi:hypothetical protein
MRGSFCKKGPQLLTRGVRDTQRSASSAGEKPYAFALPRRLHARANCDRTSLAAALTAKTLLA